MHSQVLFLAFYSADKMSKTDAFRQKAVLCSPQFVVRSNTLSNMSDLYKS